MTLVKPSVDYLEEIRSYRNDYLAACAGHIGYGVRPFEKRNGYGTRMLGLCLEEYRKRKLDRVLITCNVENEAGRKTIITCGGVFNRNANDCGGMEKG